MMAQLAKNLVFERSLCLYHYPCPDGIFAALAVHLWHKSQGRAVTFYPNRVYAPETIKGLEIKGIEAVYLVDFAGPPGFAKELASCAQRVVVLDHHKTSAAELTNPAMSQVRNLEVHFDMERSGATVAWDCFQPQGLTSAQQLLFKYIEDADLWRWRLPDSKAFHSGLASLQLEFDVTKNPSIFDQLLALTPEEVIARGKPVLEEEQRKVAAFLGQTFKVQLGGAAGAEQGWGECLAVLGGEDVAKLRSQAGNAIAEKSKSLGLRAVAAVAYIEEAMKDPTKLKCSLRSVGNEDTTVVSEAYGGGGHRNASSFIMDVNEFKTWKL